jgi:hypothetical protein
MRPHEIAKFIEEKLGPGSTVKVQRETATSFELRIEKAGQTYLRSVVAESPEALDSSLAERIAASVTR